MVTEADGVIHAKVWGILPKDRIEIKTKKENVDYRKLIAAGSCFAEGEEVIDYGFVERWILGLEEKYGVEVMQVGYDRYNAISTVQKLEANSMECVEVKQHSSVLHPPTKLLREAILKKEFAYDENRLLEINFQNARCTEDTNLNKYVNKKRSAGKVDMVVSTIIAVYLMQQAMLDNSPYTNKGTNIVRLTSFGDSSINILISAYLTTNVYATFLQQQNDLNLNIMDVMQADGVDFAFPSTSVYIEKN